MKNTFTSIFSFIIFATTTTDLFSQKGDDSAAMNMDAVYKRPFLATGKSPIAVGGYLEANTIYAQTNGISEGFQFQARRLTLFLSSTITDRIKFLSEVEFEDGGKEINIEFAAMDLEFAPELNIRGGIVMNPIGAFNQNHDGPKWDFIDRPISATTLIPSTWSNTGFGAYGKFYVNRFTIGYEAYLTNGPNPNLISNEFNRTSLTATKNFPERFLENISGIPAFTAKTALRQRKIGELGLSFYNGVYNHWKQEGIEVDKKRNVSIYAVDFHGNYFKNKLLIVAEYCKVQTNLPDHYSPNYGSNQQGGYADVVYALLRKKMLGWQRAALQAGCRFEYVDYNRDKFEATGLKIYDQLWSVVPSIAFRPTASSVIRLNYRYQRQWDLFGNPPKNTGAVLCGFSTYF